MTRHTASSLFGLAPDGVYRDGRCCHRPGALLPHPFILTLADKGGLLSVALSLTLRPPGVTRHPVRVGARTFLTPKGAAVRPPDTRSDGDERRVCQTRKATPTQRLTWLSPLARTPHHGAVGQVLFDYAARFRCSRSWSPSRISSAIFSQKAGISAGLRLVTTALSQTTD